MSISSIPFIEAWIDGVDGLQFYTRTYPATFPRAVVLFVHGFAEHIGRYEAIHAKYPARGITLFAFDQRGYGRTALDAAHRSKESRHGRTSWQSQMRDIQHFAKRLAEEYMGVPLFLMGNSMGGGLVFAFFTRYGSPPDPDTTKLFSGVIISSPLFTLTHPKSRFLRWVIAKLALFFPDMTVPAKPSNEGLSRDPAVAVAHFRDPLIGTKASLRVLDDMLSGGEQLASEDWKRWPNKLPILFVHGTADQLTSPKTTEDVCTKLEANDKKLSLYEGAYHELFNEIDGIPNRFVEECIDWIEARAPAKSLDYDTASVQQAPAPSAGAET